MIVPDGILAIPAPIARLLGRLPQRPHSSAVATTLNVAFAAQLDRDALARIRDKVIRVVVRDAGIAVTLCHDGTRFNPRSSRTAADVTIAASARDFLRLAARKEDPDTLFFGRRLTMDGDTETGLVVKNMLDALDLSPWTQRLDSLLAPLRRLRDALPGRARAPTGDRPAL